MRRVLAIGVNYKDPMGANGFAQSFLSTLGCGTAWQGGVVIADNSAQDTQAQNFDRVGEWVDTGDNLGFYGGARAAFERNVASHGLPEWLLISNVDIRFSDPQFALKLLAIESAMVLAPQIKREHPCGVRSSFLFENPLHRTRPSRAWMSQRIWLCEHFQAYSMYERVRFAMGRYAVPAVAAGGEIYSPFGALIAFHRSYFEAGASLVHPAFLFTEEIFVAEEVRRVGGKVIFAPQIGATHLGSASLRSVPSKQQAIWAAESLRAVREAYF
jgi:GT2 family glycosyltransferase